MEQIADENDSDQDAAAAAVEDTEEQQVDATDAADGEDDIEHITIGANRYLRFAVPHQATFDDLLGRHGMSMAGGTGYAMVHRTTVHASRARWFIVIDTMRSYYLVGRKKESVSASKLMVIINKTDITDATDDLETIKYATTNQPTSQPTSSGD
jgi:hypothetical protein